MPSFYDYSKQFAWDGIEKQIRQARQADVEKALSADHPTMADFAALVSPAAEPFLEQMAQRAHGLTEQRFGRVISLFAPLYLSNVCTNRCVYCGFNAGNIVDRLTLSPEEAAQEAHYLYQEGFRHILLVAGEAPKIVTPSYLADVIKRLRPEFSSISIELFPMETLAYKALVDAGVDGLVIFQETYNEKLYAKVHPAGYKSNFKWRLETPDRGGAAGMRRIGLGALLGLSDWRVEGFFLALHAQYLLRHYWRSQVTISFPRLQPATGGFHAPYPVSDAHMVQLLAALRMFLPDAGMILSTREKPEFRDALIPLGITIMSAGSKTDPGGYTRESGAEAQFEIADHRSPEVVADIIRQKGFEAVWKDWDAAFLQ
ncbi:MAG: 2-iminoacetate synthase ThiH [Deltaproteobacteria bacterium]|nr:2-iminoacetate synthase ThiH [Deltaproteobacteria bacterium]